MSDELSIQEKFAQLAKVMRVAAQMIDEIESEVTSEMEASRENGDAAAAPAPGPGMGPWGMGHPAQSGYGPMPPWMWPGMNAPYAWWPMMMPPWSPGWVWGGGATKSPTAPAPAAAHAPGAASQWTWSWDTTEPPYATEQRKP